MPWTRCMKMVECSKIDFGMDAYHDNERANRFSFSLPYRQLTPQYFKLVTNTKARILTKQDLKKYIGCGLNGSSYAHYGFSEKNLDQGAKDYPALLAKLELKRCDYFLEELEVISGFRLLGKDYLAGSSIVHGPVVGVTPPGLHLITGHKNSRTLKIMKDFNHQIEQMKQSGELDRIYGTVIKQKGR